jgi:hypothetical protein
VYFGSFLRRFFRTEKERKKSRRNFVNIHLKSRARKITKIRAKTNGHEKTKERECLVSEKRKKTEREREGKFREFEKRILPKEKSKKPRKQKRSKTLNEKCDQTNFKNRVF